jgi:uncharacterized protein
MGRNPRSYLWGSRLIALDTNLLIYAYRRGSPFHAIALHHMRLLVEGENPWAIAWPCLHEFISVATNPKVFATHQPRRSLQSNQRLASSGKLRFLGESFEHLDVIRTLLTIAKARGGQIHDARIAAICLPHGVSELWTADRDFSRFPKLKTRNPLLG